MIARGPRGVWTLKHAGQPVPAPKTTFIAAKPSLTHQVHLCALPHVLCMLHLDAKYGFFFPFFLGQITLPAILAQWTESSRTGELVTLHLLPYLHTTRAGDLPAKHMRDISHIHSEGNS